MRESALEREYIMSERITGHTELLTLMAYPIRHSNSPAMHNEALAKLGLDYAYLCFDVDHSNLKEAIQAMRTLKVRGGNISAPNKIEVMKYLDWISPEAELFGAVNTIVNDDGRLSGYVTDGEGFMNAIRDRGIDIRGKKVTVAGAGGVGKAIEMKLALEGVSEISIFNIRDEFWPRAYETTKVINAKFDDCHATLYDLDDKAALKREIWDSYLMVNATSVGMEGTGTTTVIPDFSWFRPGMYVMDVIYAPLETIFLKQAREAGCLALNGLSMMLYQGAASFKLWMGQDMPIDHMKKVLGVVDEW